MSSNSGGRVLGAATSIGGATLVAHTHKSLLQSILIITVLSLAGIVIVSMIISRLYRKFAR
jgi:predicted RND superfamily exporter protein